MADFIARVELHADAIPADYETVHALMKTCGFERWVIGAASDEPFRLPAGTYVGKADLNSQQAFDMVKEALNVAFPGVAFGVVLAEIDGLLFEGLAAAV